MNKDFAGSKFMLFLIIWSIIVLFVIIGVLEVLYVTHGLDTNAVLMSPWFLIGYQLVNLMLPLAIWMLIKREGFSNTPNWKLGGKNIILIVALSFLLQPAMMLLSAISSLFFPNPIADMLNDFTQHPFLLVVVAAAVTPAICEEVVFRGYIQSRQRGTIMKVALLNGLFFAIIHLNLHQFAYTFAMGVVFAYLVYYTRSVWAGILPHFIINATQATWGRLAMLAEVAEDAPEPHITDVIIVFGVIALILMPVIAVLFRSFVRHNRWRLTAKEQHGSEPDDYTHNYDYEHDSGYGVQPADTSWLAAGFGDSGQVGGEVVPAEASHDAPPDTPVYSADEKPSGFDFYAVAVVVIFVAIMAMSMAL